MPTTHGRGDREPKGMRTMTGESDDTLDRG